MVWALAAGGALFWGLKVLVKAPPAPPHTQTARATVAARGDLSRLLGADAAPLRTEDSPAPAAAARFQLVGVLSPRSTKAAREGLALIAVDGKPARAYRVGAVVDGENILQTVAARGATLGPRGGAALVALNLAPPAPAATGVLPVAGAPPQPQPQPLPGAPGAPGVPGTVGRRTSNAELAQALANQRRAAASVSEADGTTPPDAAPTR